MGIRFFARWNWEHDRGETPLSAGSALPFTYATAYYDYADRLYRVVVKNPNEIRLADGGATPAGVCVYDYCDDGGTIREKRSLEENGDIGTIVRFRYDDAGKVLSEVAWSPDQDGPPVEAEGGFRSR